MSLRSLVGNLSSQVELPVASGDEQQSWHCTVCNAVRPSRHSPAVHVFRAHGVRQPQHFYVDGTQCPVCLVEFGTRIRLREHLSSDLKSMKPQKSPICWDECLKRYAPFSEEYAQVLADEDLQTSRSKKKSGFRRTHAKYRSVQAQGPMMFIQLSHLPNGVIRHTNNKRIRRNMVIDGPGRVWLRETVWCITVD